MAIYKDEKRGTWYYQTRVEYVDGTKAQKKKRGFKTKKEAKIAEALAIEEASHQMPGGKKAVTTFEDVAKDYMEWHAARHKASTTVKIESVFNAHFIPQFGEREISKIKPGDIMDYQTVLIGKYSGRYVSMMHAVLSNLFKYAVTKEYIKENPAKIAGSPQVSKPKMVNYWTLEEFQDFISHVDDRMYHALFMTLYYSGLRKGELRALTWADLDFKDNVITVSKTNYKGHIQTPKTSAGFRKVPMPEHVMKLLKKLRIQRNPSPTLDHVVFGEFHDAIGETTLSRWFKKYLDQSGVKKIRMHDIRHSHASYLIDRNVPVSVVAARLGHGDVAMTLNVYSHMFPSKEKEAVSAMEDDFSKAPIIEMLPNGYHDAEKA